MKKYIILLVAIFISMNTKADVFEIVSFKYKDDVPFDIQQNSIASLNDIASTFPGFKSRTFYYSKENGRWFDLITWASLAQAKAASEKAMQALHNRRPHPRHIRKNATVHDSLE